MIEPLESRIAPATLTGRVVKYVDVDGDAVTVTLTKGAVSAANFVFNNSFGSTGPQELQRIDVSSVADVDGSNITVAVKKAATGDGIANIGAIVASGHDLGVVKMKGNLGSISGGNALSPTPGIVSLNVGSLGVVGTAAQGPANSSILGAVTTATIAGDLGRILATFSIGTLKLGGSLIDDGRLAVTGNLTRATIGGILTRPDGNDIDFYVLGNMTTLTIRGSILGGNVTSDIASPQILVEGNVGKIMIGGDVRGPSGPFDQASLRVDGTVGSLTVGGSVVGNAALGVVIQLAHRVNTFGKGVGSVLIKGSTHNMVLAISTFLTNSQSKVDSIVINGAFLTSGIAVSGGAGVDQKFGTTDDTITASSVINSLVIKGPVFGTSGLMDSYAITAGKIVKAKITGRTLALAGGTQTISIASSNDVSVRDLV